MTWKREALFETTAGVLRMKMARACGSVYLLSMQDFEPNKIRPLWNQVLIEEDEKPTMSESGTIILPDTARDAKVYTPATVLAVGRGRLSKKGKLVEPELRIGDRVILGKAHGTLVHGERIRMIDADVIEGVFEPGDE